MAWGHHISLRHLRYVIAAVEQGSFRRASRTLGVQESAISRRIRDLEDEIGAALFIRHHSGVELTYAGRVFLDRAKKVISHIDHAARDVGAAGRGEQGAVRIGIFSSLASGFLAELLQAYDAGRAGVRLDFIEGGCSDHVPAVQQHRIDVAFLAGMPMADGCDVAHLWNERVYVAMSGTNELAGREEIKWNDLRGRHFIVSEARSGGEMHDYLVKHLAELGHRPSIERQAVCRDTLMQIVSNGKGLTLACEATIAARFPGVVYRPISGEILPFCAVWSPKNDNPAFRRLLSLAKVMSTQCRSRSLMGPQSDLSSGKTGHGSEHPAAFSQSLGPLR